MNETEAADKAVPAALAQRPGRVLSEARAAKGLAVAEVAAQLRLSASQVTALEADDYERLPGPVFVRGFVRNYARLLGLDPEKLADSIELPHAAVPASAAIPVSREIPFPARKSASWRPYAAALAVLVGVVAIYELYYASPHSVTVSVPQPVAAPVLQPVPTVDETPVVSAVVAANPLPAEAEPVSQPPQPSEAAGKPADVPAGMAEARFEFASASWVEVRDRSERVLLSQLNPAGSEQRVTGRPPFSVVIGNARDVRLIFNGKPVDLAPHTRVEVARLILE